MKAFAAVLVVAFILGGLVGGEIFDSGFSITGAVIGGLGTFAVLMGLGAFFTAREEKGPKSTLPPEIRGVFDRMTQNAGLMAQRNKSNQKPAHKPVAKPFYQNKNRTERIEWFKGSPQWKVVDQRIIEQLCDKFGENPLFEVFVLLSIENNLVQQFARLNPKASTEGGLLSVCPEISQILCVFGREKSTDFFAALKSRDEAGMRSSYAPACDAIETAMVMEPMNIQPYWQMTLLKMAVKKYQEARDYGMQGMLVAEKLKLTPLGKSQHPDVAGSLSMLEMYSNMLADQVAEAIKQLEGTSS